MTLQRQLAPGIQLPEKISLTPAEKISTENEIPILVIRAGSQQVVKIEFVFNAGNIVSDRPLLAAAANDLLDEGTSRHTSSEIAELLDYYGAYFSTENGPDWSTVTLFSLNKFVKETLPHFAEALTDPAYPQKEIDTYSTQGKQRLAVGLSKVDFLARRNFFNALYGDTHPLGRMTKSEDYDALTPELLRSYHTRHYLEGLKTVIISGQPDNSTIETIKNFILQTGFKKAKAAAVSASGAQPVKKLIEKSDAIQSAIRIGRIMFNRNHPDYFPFTILNTVLGGYFGSRLMSNIREDKGYTYGIGSGIISHIDDGYFFISTEVGAEVREAAIHEIYKELARLREELIPEEELTLVKNYMIGAFQRSIDGPFAQADRHKIITLHQLTPDYYDRYLETIRTVTPADLMMLANKYLEENSMFEIIAGK
jgi:predicted Zn-dependent peptidase